MAVERRKIKQHILPLEKCLLLAKRCSVYSCSLRTSTDQQSDCSPPADKGDHDQLRQPVAEEDFAPDLNPSVLKLAGF
jgi:hypothetical protein